MVPKKPQSKRGRMAHRYRIKRRINDHQRKERRAAKANPSKHKKAKKDPGIPNNWPFKEEMLNEIEAQRQEAEEEKLRNKHARQVAKAKAKKAAKKTQQPATTA